MPTISRCPGTRWSRPPRRERRVTFYTWWGEEFWRDAGKDFEASYGIHGPRHHRRSRPPTSARWWRSRVSAHGHDRCAAWSAASRSSRCSTPRRSTARWWASSPIPTSSMPKLFAIQEGFAHQGLSGAGLSQPGRHPHTIPRRCRTRRRAGPSSRPGWTPIPASSPSTIRAKGGSGQAFVQTVLREHPRQPPRSYAGDTEMDESEGGRLGAGVGLAQRQRGASSRSPRPTTTPSTA